MYSVVPFSDVCWIVFTITYVYIIYHQFLNSWWLSTNPLFLYTAWIVSRWSLFSRWNKVGGRNFTVGVCIFVIVNVFSVALTLNISVVFRPLIRDDWERVIIVKCNKWDIRYFATTYAFGNRSFCTLNTKKWFVQSQAHFYKYFQLADIISFRHKCLLSEQCKVWLVTFRFPVYKGT